MGRSCSVCQNPKREEINVALAAGQPYRSVAKHFEASEAAVFRHARGHLPVGLVEAEKKRQLREAEEFLLALEELHALTAGALKKAKEKGDLTAIARLVIASKGLIETAARLTGELRDAPAAQVAVVLRWGDDPALGAPPAALPPALEAEVVKTEGEGTP